MQLINRPHYFFIGLLLLSHYQMRATVFGYDNKVVAELAAFTFPSGQADNRLATYGLAENGFAIANSSTSAVFDSIFPVSGTINLNSGTLVLNRDLIFRNISTLQGLGTINGQNHTVTLSHNTTSLPINTNKFQDTTLILNNDVTLSSAITFTGTCFIEGNGHQLILGANGGIKVGNNSTLLLHDVILNGVGGTNVQCLNDFSLLILDNATWIQAANSSFVLGALQFRNEITMVGKSVFAYQSINPSLISSHATLVLDQGFTFSYDPVRLGSKNLLQCADATANIFMNGATLHVTTTGLNLTRGSLHVRGDSTFVSETKTINNTVVDQGITLGDGISAVNDCVTTIMAGARLRVAQGSLNYKNISSASWFMENGISQLNMGLDTTLRLYQTLNLGLGMALCDEAVTVARVPQAQLLGNVSAVGQLFFAQL